jgi:hypothetical protein
LADDEFICRNWVQHLNVAIREAGDDTKAAPATKGADLQQGQGQGHTYPTGLKQEVDKHVPVDKSNVNMSQDYSGRSVSQNDTRLELQSPVLQSAAATAVPPTLPRYHEQSDASKLFMSPNRAVAGTSVQAAGSRDNYFNSSLSNISRIPNVAISSSSASGNNSSPESLPSDSTQEREREREQERERGQGRGQERQRAAESSPSRRRQGPRAGLEQANLHRSEFSGRKTVEVLEIEVEELQVSYNTVETEMRERIGALTAKYNEMRDRDRKVIAELRVELEERAMQVESEGHDVHAGQLRALKETHRREVSCLTDDIISERKKYEALLLHERTAAKAAEQRESDIRKELIDVTTQCHRLEAETLRLKDTAVLDSRGLAVENERLRQEIAHNAEKIGSIQESSTAKANESLAITVEKMNSKFSETVGAIERAAYDAAKKKFDVQKMQELASMQIECNRQIEEIRGHNKLANASEVESLKKNYEQREQQTMLDLKHLESLHARRVGELETAVAAWRARAETSAEKAATAFMSAAKGSEASRSSAEDTMRQLECHAVNVEQLQTALKQKHEELLESRSRETSYREHLNRAIEECRVQRAQNLDSLRQSSCDGAQAVHWKRVAQEVEVSMAASNTSMQIARDEVVMLENDVQRLTSQNRSLQEALNRADRIVYGNNAAAVVKSKDPAAAAAAAAGGSGGRPSPANGSVRGVSLQDTRMSKRSVVKTLYSPVNDENRRNAFSPEEGGRVHSSGKRVTMYL